MRRDLDFRKAYSLQFVNKGVGLDLRPKNATRKTTPVNNAAEGNPPEAPR
jgi:hypothetical protein